LPDVLKIRLERPAWPELSRIANLEQRLVAASPWQTWTEPENVPVVRYASIGEADPESVFGSVGDHAAEGNAAIGIEIN
jgi:hypothetical protein